VIVVKYILFYDESQLTQLKSEFECDR